ncbi:MAG: ATP-binding protein [Solirubrobacteraceae bacterium]
MTRTLDIARDDRAPSEARHALRELAPRLDAGVLDDAGLLVSELVANSVRHGTGDHVRVTLDPGPDGALRCEVTDEGHGFLPLSRPVGTRDDGGWGLFLVETLSSAWGVREGSTHVWFQLTP